MYSIYLKKKKLFTIPTINKRIGRSVLFFHLTPKGEIVELVTQILFVSGSVTKIYFARIPFIHRYTEKINFLHLVCPVYIFGNIKKNLINENFL